MIFGLMGYAGSGKDTLAKILIGRGWKRLAFGDKVKECLYNLNPTIYGQSQAFPLQECVDGCGWDVVKQWPEVRRLLQRLGSEMGRDVISEHLWVNLLIPELLELRSSYNIVVTDVRFPNEASLIDKANGKLIRVTRPGIEPPNEHASEIKATTITPDFTIDNSGDLSHLESQLDAILLPLQEFIL